MRRLQWAEYSKVLRDNTLHQERFESANDLFLSEYRGFFEEPGLGRIDVSSVRGIGHYTIKKTRATLKDEVEFEMKIDEPLFTVGFLYSGSFVRLPFKEILLFNIFNASFRKIKTRN